MAYLEYNKSVWYLASKVLFMADWDVDTKDTLHYPGCVTVQSKFEATQIIGEFVKRNPEYVFRVYETPGGIHAFCLSHMVPAGTMCSLQLSKALGVDPFYQNLCFKSKRYTYRVSPKPFRKDDYVAKLLTTVGLIHNVIPELKEEMDYHDSLIQNYV